MFSGPGGRSRMSPKTDRRPPRASPWSGSSRCNVWLGERTTTLNRDFRDLLAEFNAHGVEYIVVGAHALAAHGHVRATKDLDVWVRPNSANAG